MIDSSFALRSLARPLAGVLMTGIALLACSSTVAPPGNPGTGQAQNEEKAHAATGRATNAASPTAPSAPTSPTASTATPSPAAACAPLAESACVADTECFAGYVGFCDCASPSGSTVYGPPVADYPPLPGPEPVTHYRAYETPSPGCPRDCFLYAACVPKPHCDGADEASCRAQPGCFPTISEICDCTCDDPEAASCAECSASCRPFVSCRDR